MATASVSAVSACASMRPPDMILTGILRYLLLGVFALFLLLLLQLIRRDLD